MSKERRILDIAVELERLSGVTPTDGLRREVNDEARLKRIADSLVGIAALGGGSSSVTVLKDLNDVEAALSPTSGQVLSYNGTSWAADDASGGATVLNDLTDVSGSPSSGQVLTYNGSNWAPAASAVVAGVAPRTLHIESPDDTEDITYFFTNAAITLSELRVVLVGDTSPSVTWTLKHATDRSAAGTTAKSGTTTAVTSGDDFTTFTDDTIPADSFVWLETSAQSGNVYEMSLTLYFNED